MSKPPVCGHLLRLSQDTNAGSSLSRIAKKTVPFPFLHIWGLVLKSMGTKRGEEEYHGENLTLQPLGTRGSPCNGKYMAPTQGKTENSSSQKEKSLKSHTEKVPLLVLTAHGLEPRPGVPGRSQLERGLCRCSNQSDGSMCLHLTQTSPAWDIRTQASSFCPHLFIMLNSFPVSIPQVDSPS